MFLELFPMAAIAEFSWVEIIFSAMDLIADDTPCRKLGGISANTLPHFLHTLLAIVVLCDTD